MKNTVCTTFNVCLMMEDKLAVSLNTGSLLPREVHPLPGLEGGHGSLHLANTEVQSQPERASLPTGQTMVALTGPDACIENMHCIVKVQSVKNEKVAACS